MAKRNAGIKPDFFPAKNAIKIEKLPRSEILFKRSNATSDDFYNTTCPPLSLFSNTASSRTTVTLAVSAGLYKSFITLDFPIFIASFAVGNSR